MLTTPQTAAIIRSISDFFDFEDQVQDNLAQMLCFAMGGPKPKDPDKVLFELIDVLGSEHSCIGPPGSTDVTEGYIAIIRELIYLSDEKAKRCKAKASRRCTRKKAGAK